MLTFPFCKINLGLHIINKRPDGFHNIETVFYPVETITDVLEIIPSEQFDFQCFGVQIDGEKEDNLVVKAYNLMKQHYHLPPVSISLLKKIPAGAGLGGGSSDAAAALVLLNKLFNLHLDTETLKTHAATLGSDCPFFIEGTPAFACGRGENLIPCNCPELEGKHIVVVKPDIHISTADAYCNCKPSSSEMNLREIIQKPISSWKTLLKNDFEKTLFPAYPRLAEIKENLYQQGAMYASLSGSGSALFGIFEQNPVLKIGETLTI
ncbi:MAG: 4-(cytidine 5'-diphospho)-2-C-methyl-D-erythritol kinase [Lentimicrobiaceae bacterium]|nr:4-(cytidine 5'-diphospho)-2-C-methyl-D-erythritol kinase [Lentimicrobiaceae bacterium]